MERLNKLTETLNVLRHLSHQIISTALPIMKELENPNSELVNEFMDERPGIDRNTATTILQTVSLELVNDAKVVNEEIESFSASVIYGEDGISEGEDEYPFLIQVWYGDMYGDSEINGLQALVIDLQSQLSKIDEDVILKNALSKLRPG
jgi:hypothetical protein